MSEPETETMTSVELQTGREPLMEPEPEPSNPEPAVDVVAFSSVVAVGYHSQLVLPAVLHEPMCFLSAAQVELCCRKGLDDLAVGLPCWVSQARVSAALFGANGAAYLETTRKVHGNFVWATEFANVHATFAFTESPIMIDGVEHKSAEHYFQLMKSFGTPSHDAAKVAMANATGELEAWGVGQRLELREDWETAKVQVMRTAITAKFQQSETLRALLLSTGEFPLVQLKPDDEFWGTGKHGTGRNMLGQLLVALRRELGAAY